VLVTPPVAQTHACALFERLPLVTYSLLLEPPYPSLFVSPQLEWLFGYSPEECVAKRDFWMSKLAPQDRPRLEAALDALRETHEPMSVEYRLTALDGREVCVRDIAIVAREDDGLLYAHGYLSDVTREWTLARELADERAQADALFRASPAGLALTDGEGRYLRVNEALARLNGAPVAEHLGKTLAEVAPSIAASVQPVLDEVQRSGVGVSERELHVDVDGEERVVVASFFPIATETETYYGRIVIDVTAERRAEDEREAAERRYRELISQLPLVTYVNEIDPSYRTSYVSPQIEALYGYPVEDWLADVELWNRVVHPDDLEHVLQAEAEARERHERFELEYRFVRADGRTGWVLDRMETIYDDDGTPLVERGFLVDVTERRESEQMFRAMFENAHEAVLLLDDEGRLIDANGAAEQLLGRTRAELVGISIPDFVEDDARALANWQTVLATGEAAGATVLTRPGGERREVELSAKANALPGRHLVVARDVTERRALERELWQAQRLESVGRLAGGVAQDFNNMLTTIRGYAQLLVDRAEPGSVEGHHAGEIDAAAARAAALTAQLLALGRGQTLQKRVIDLNRLVGDLAGMLRRIAGPGVDLSYELEPALCATFVDAGQIEQVLLNLVRNAAEAMGGEGSVTVRTATVDVPAGAAGDEGIAAGRYAVVSVEDSGPGIDPATLAHLFEPFFTTKPIGAGSGLGLAASYGIAKQSGGSIVVDTEPGRGSRFSVYLPEHRAEGDPRVG
jgi:PAS domain S-box-containing protein